MEHVFHQLDGEHVIDVVSANYSCHPMFDNEGKPSLNEVWSLVNCPTEKRRCFCETFS